MFSFTHARLARLVWILVCIFSLVPLLTSFPALAATTPSITFVPGGGAMGEDAIIVSGSGATANLNDVKTALATNGQANLLTEDVVNGQHIWTLYDSLLVQNGATLLITAGSAGVNQGAQVDWLRLRSDPGVTKDVNNPAPYYSHFVSLRTKDAFLTITGAVITSWDTSAQTYDTTITDGRAYVVAKGKSVMNIFSSNLSYLGSSDGESYGVAWRDTDVDSSTGLPRTRVTGDVEHSIFSHNYYGLYTFQAGGDKTDPNYKRMQFVDNKMFTNIEYGFDPHDYTHDVDVENNESYDNGSHGYIISRGCTGFMFLNNKSHDNKVRAGSKNPSAHGFMLDPGADPVKAGVPQAPSTNNTYIGNQAYNNDGYGFRILQSNNNTIQDNIFTNNRAGISLEGRSTGNVIDNNTISGSTGLPSGSTVSQGYGIQIVTAADTNTITNNTISNNAVVGINVKTGNNTITGNTITGNTGAGISVAQDTGGSDETEPPADGTTPDPTTFTKPDSNTLSNNTITATTGKGIVINAANATVVQGNTVEQNSGTGISITGSETGTLVQQNMSNTNSGYGIEVYGASSTRNTFTQNVITGNTGSSGISVRSSANAGMTAPTVKTPGAGTITGTTVASAVIEVFSDNGSQAAYYEGRTTADATGAFTYTFATAPQGTNITVTATDTQGNTSPLSTALAVQKVSATLTPSKTTVPTKTTTPATATPSATATATATATAIALPSATATATATGVALLGTATPTTTLGTATASPATTIATITATVATGTEGQRHYVYLPIVIR